MGEVELKIDAGGAADDEGGGTRGHAFAQAFNAGLPGRTRLVTYAAVSAVDREIDTLLAAEIQTFGASALFFDARQRRRAV